MGIRTVEEIIKRIAPEHRREFCDFITYGKLTKKFKDVLNRNEEYKEILQKAMEIEYVDIKKK